jgi:WS/DGAT/MGAT family acyltransferase
MNSQPLSPVDAAWFHIDGPVNSAVITSALTTRQPLVFERVKEVYTQRLARFERFRQRVVEKGFPLATPHWEDMPDFEIEQQLHHVALPAPGNRAALTALIEDLASTPMDRARPLWDVHVVNGVGGGAALITRIHHCIGDGTANMAIARALFDTAPDATAEEVDESAHAPAGRLFAPAVGADDGPLGGVRAAMHSAVETVRHPQKALEHAARVVAGAVTLVGELARRRDPPSPFKGAFGLKKRVAWSDPVALSQIKEIGAPLGAKINDVLVAGMTGALREYLKQRGVAVDRMTLRATVPVDLRPPERALELGNQFDLAIRSRDRLARVRLTKARMDRLKRSPEPAAVLALFNLFGRGPKVVEDFALQLFSSKASVVMTNVAGPKDTLYLAGVPIDRVMFWVPHPGRELGMGISILSYKGHATLAVIADAHLVPDPEAITAQFHREFDAMRAQLKRRAKRTPVPRKKTAPKKAQRARPVAKKRAAAKSARR